MNNIYLLPNYPTPASASDPSDDSDSAVYLYEI